MVLAELCHSSNTHTALGLRVLSNPAEPALLIVLSWAPSTQWEAKAGPGKVDAIPTQTLSICQ